MKISRIVLGALAIVAVMGSCKCVQTSQGDNSQNALDWAGVYSGVVPCASCPGIQTVIKLNSDLTYRLEATYIDQEGAPLVKTGKFEWNEKGHSITLLGFEKGEGSNRYQVGENRLIQLDLEGNKVSGALADQYVLNKGSELIERYWKLVEINGKGVTPSDTDREAHLVFKAFDNRFHGSTGCNSFFGQYEMKDGQQVAFSQAGSTRMMCPDMSVEDQMLKLFGQSFSYVLEGQKLMFKDASGQVVAHFELGEMK